MADGTGSQAEPSQPRDDPEPSSHLLTGELFWRKHYDWLRAQGYQLRSRYDPHWVPSWEADKKIYYGLTLDSKYPPHQHLMDATRIADETPVVLKMVDRQESPSEVDILKYFSEEPIASDPKNRCIRLLEVLQPPDEEERLDIVVLPLLRPCSNPPFDTVGEVLDFISQILEGFAFLHEHRVAHRDIRKENILLDGGSMYSKRFFTWSPDLTADLQHNLKPKFSRTERPPRYYIIDFGFSSQYAPEEIPPSVLPKIASDPSAPEFDRKTVRSNPFPIDVYTTGNLIAKLFIDANPVHDRYEGRRGLEFLSPLVEEMTRRDPSGRLTMKEALARFNELVDSQSTWRLRSRAFPTGQDDLFTRIQDNAAHWARKLSYILRRLPPIPDAHAVARGGRTGGGHADGADVGGGNETSTTN